MRRSTFPIFVILALLFMTFGSLLPGPMGQYSTQMRQATNRFVMRLFPQRRPKLSPNERTERQLEDIENQN